MDRVRPPGPPRRRGFTMLELIIVIAVVSILAAIVTPLAVEQITQKRYEACREELVLLRKALVGDTRVMEGGNRSNYGFLGDVGALPVVLDELLQPGSRPLFQAYTLGGTTFHHGWRGPYVSEILDPWGNAYHYLVRTVSADDKRRAFLWSAGPDGVTDPDPAAAAYTTNAVNADNVLVAILQDEVETMITGNTYDPCDVGAAFSAIAVSYPTGVGAPAPVAVTAPLATTTADPNYLVAAPLPLGIRIIGFTTDTGVTVHKLIYLNNGPLTVVNLKAPGVCN